MDREPTPPPGVNRVAKFLPLLEAKGPPGPRAPRQPPVPRITHLVVPPVLSVSGLAAALGCKTFVVVKELMEIDIFAHPTAPLDFATMVRVCARLDVRVEPGI
jgi:hypothetical protein